MPANGLRANQFEFVALYSMLNNLQLNSQGHKLKKIEGCPRICDRLL